MEDQQKDFRLPMFSPLRLCTSARLSKSYKGLQIPIIIQLHEMQLIRARDKYKHRGSKHISVPGFDLFLEEILRLKFSSTSSLPHAAAQRISMHSSTQPRQYNVVWHGTPKCLCQSQTIANHRKPSLTPFSNCSIPTSDGRLLFSVNRLQDAQATSRRKPTSYSVKRPEESEPSGAWSNP